MALNGLSVTYSVNCSSDPDVLLLNVFVPYVSISLYICPAVNFCVSKNYRSVMYCSTVDLGSVPDRGC